MIRRRRPRQTRPRLRRRLASLVGAASIAILSVISVAAASQPPRSATPIVAAAPGEGSSTRIAVGGTHACALPGDGTVRCWGDNSIGQLGDGFRTEPGAPAGDVVKPPVTVIAGEGQTAALTGATAITAGYAHTCALLADTTVRCWGANEAIPDGGPFGPPPRSGGQVGDGTTAERLAPVTVVIGRDSPAPLTGVASISAGGDYTCALLVDGTARCWGNAPQATGLVPVPVMRDASTPLGGVIAITTGDHHACALMATGTVACWGANYFGQLGADIGDTSQFPVQVVVGGPDGAPLSGVTAITASHSNPFGPNGIGSGHTCALLVDATVACWGINDVSQLGNGPPGESDTQPWASLVLAGEGSTAALSGVIEIAAGWAHTCALLADATVACWGLSFGDPPGNPGGFEGSGAPIEVLSDAAAIAAGTDSCAVLAKGVVVCGVGADGGPFEVPGLLIAAPVATPAPATPAPTSATGPTAGPAASQGPGASPQPAGSARPGPIATLQPSFAGAVASPTDISLDPIVMLQSLALAAGILLFVPFPSAFVNNTLEANYSEISGNVRGIRRRVMRPLQRARALLGRPGRIDRPPEVDGAPGSAAASTATPFWQSTPGIVLFVLLIALLSSYLDPMFWSRSSSWATFAGLLLGLVVTLVVFNLPTARAYRRRDITFVVRALPGTIAIAIACLLISRFTNFQPGYLYGLIIGLSAAKTLGKADEARTAAIGTVLALVVGLAAWFALWWLRSMEPAGAEPSFVLVALETTLAAMVVAGIEGAAIGSLPLKSFGGEKVRRWRPLVWIVLGAIAGGLFLHILVNPSSGYLSDSSRTPLVTIVLLLTAFGVGSLAFWAWFHYRPKRKAPPT